MDFCIPLPVKRGNVHGSRPRIRFLLEVFTVARKSPGTSKKAKIAWIFRNLLAAAGALSIR
jgi:hypothetical protein